MIDYTKLEEVDGELVLPISNAILQQLGWNLGDTLVWDLSINGEITLKKTDLTRSSE